MNINVSYKYQLLGHKYPIILFYIIVICTYTILFINTASQLYHNNVTNYSSGAFIGTSSYSAGSFGGIGASTAIFIFIISLNSFKEGFKMMLQNGLTRRTILVGRILTTLSVAFGLAIIDQILLLIFKFVASTANNHLRCTSLFEQAYEHRASELSVIGLNLETILFDFCVYVGFMSLGYFITLLFYRLNNIGKTIVGAGVPILLFVIIPVLDFYVTEKNIYAGIGNVFFHALGFSSGKPINTMLAFIVLFILLYSFCWLIIRKAPVKE